MTKLEPSTDVLLAEYKALCEQQWETRKDTDREGRISNRRWNRLADRISAVYRQLKARGDEGMDAILTLVEDENPNVRFTAAVNTLKRRPETSLPVLQGMLADRSKRDGFLPVGVMLNMWNQGHWDVVDPD